MPVSSSNDLVDIVPFFFFLFQNAIQVCAQLKPPGVHWDLKFILIFPVDNAALYTSVVSPLEIDYND